MPDETPIDPTPTTSDAEDRAATRPNPQPPRRSRVSEARARQAEEADRAAGFAAAEGAAAAEALAAGSAPGSADAGGTIRVERTCVNELNAHEVDVRFGAVGRVRADSVDVSMGAVGLARADRVTVGMGSVGAVFANEVRVSQGFARGIVAREVQLEQAGAQSIIAGRVTMGPRSGALVVLAGRVDGEVRSVLDWRAGLALVSLLSVVWLAIRSRGRARD